MRLLALSAAAASLASCAPPEPAPPAARQAVELAGRTAGTPVRCLPALDGQQFRVSETDRSTLIYGTGDKLWVNRLAPSCRFTWNEVPVFEVFGSSYCRGDLVRSVDQSTRMPGPGCPLGDFVPYTRP